MTIKKWPKKEIIRSIKMFEVIDKEGANILESLL